MGAADDVRDEVRTWLAEHWDPERPLADWRQIVVDSGWACPTWPVQWYGKGLSPVLAGVVTEEFDRVGAVGAAGGSGLTLAAPTILAHGSDLLKRTLLRRIATGEDTWCQLFSEPGNGSDLAGLSTRADRDGDEWVVSGQKVWNTGAHKAAWGMLLARTDWDVPKHRGITYFAVPMRQPGVEVRPLVQMNRYQSFNEVFLTEARVADEHRIGDVGQGWAAAMTTLAHERGLQAIRLSRVPDGLGRCAREAAEEAVEYAKTYVWYPQRAGRSDLLIPRARATGAASDPLARQAITSILALEKAARWNVERGKAARAAGRPPGPEGSLGKLSASMISKRSAAAHAAMTGADAMLTGPDSPEAGIIAEIIVSSPAVSIAGGTDEIQHDILGERMLGLPKEPSVDKDIAFRDVRRN